MNTRFPLALALASLAVACSHDAASETKVDFGQTLQAIVGGEPADGPDFAAVGALVAMRPVFDHEANDVRIKTTPFCTGSLISESTVLTAKHCTELVLASLDQDDVALYFAVGADATNPERKIPIADALGAPGDEGGFVHYGRDVGVVFLGENIDDITPLKIAGMEDKHVGKDFEVVGFGVQNAVGFHGTRMKGSVRLQALEGRVFELALGGYAGFETWLAKEVLRRDPPKPAASAVLDAERDGGADALADAGQLKDAAQVRSTSAEAEAWAVRYNTTVLDPGYEAFVGNDEGDPQPCSGDSGGPLVRNGEVFGVASGVLRSSERVCDHGTVYATFGPEVLDFIKLAKKGRCMGVSEGGECRGRRVVQGVMNGSTRMPQKAR